jgi:hypothetical protein
MHSAAFLNLLEGNFLASFEAKSLNLKGWAKLAGLHRAESSARHQTQERGRLIESKVLKPEKIK